MKLFWMEVKRQTTSLTFTIYTLLVMAFVLLNMWPMLARNVAALPTSTNSYDDITVTDFQTRKTNGVGQLRYDYQHNTYVTYPLGFAKTVTLPKADQARVRSLLTQANQAETQATLVKALGQVDRLIGGQSAYSSQNIQGFASRPMTKAEARQDHNLILKKTVSVVPLHDYLPITPVLSWEFYPPLSSSLIVMLIVEVVQRQVCNRK